jgi:hypothetical protein
MASSVSIPQPTLNLLSHPRKCASIHHNLSWGRANINCLTSGKTTGSTCFGFASVHEACKKRNNTKVWQKKEMAAKYGYLVQMPVVPQGCAMGHVLTCTAQVKHCWCKPQRTEQDPLRTKNCFANWGALPAVRRTLEGPVAKGVKRHMRGCK